MTERYDIAVIGAGMAGASLAAELAPHARVLLVEAEAQPGYHTTGRSAAFWEECYGGPDVVPLTLASGPYLRERGMLSPRGALYVAREGDEAAVSAFLDRFADTGVTIEPLDRAALERRIPGLRPEWTRAVAEPACADIDVAGLHQHYLALARRGGAELRTSARLEAAEREGGSWRLQFTRGERGPNSRRRVGGPCRHARRSPAARHRAAASHGDPAAHRPACARRPAARPRSAGHILFQARARAPVALPA
jgi:D-arginine dehydrogenase